MKEHRNLLLPAICVLYDKGRGDKSEFEDLASSGNNLIVIDHPDPKSAPMFLVNVATASTCVLVLNSDWCVYR
jgi:hypothetical protein